MEGRRCSGDGAARCSGDGATTVMEVAVISSTEDLPRRSAWGPVAGLVCGRPGGDSSEVASGDGVEDPEPGTVDGAGSLTSPSSADSKDDPCHGTDDTRGMFPPESSPGLTPMVSRPPQHMKSCEFGTVSSVFSSKLNPAVPDAIKGLDAPLVGRELSCLSTKIAFPNSLNVGARPGERRAILSQRREPTLG